MIHYELLADHEKLGRHILITRITSEKIIIIPKEIAKTPMDTNRPMYTNYKILKIFK